MNNKIITAALKGINPNPELLAKIVSYVPNPEVAVEMLLGVFEEPVVENMFYRPKWNEHTTVKAVISIDPLGDTITYEACSRNTQRVWYINKGDKALGIYVIDRPSNYDDYGDIQVNGYSTSKHTVSAKEFYKENNPIDAKSFRDQLDEWDMFGITVTEENVLPF